MTSYKVHNSLNNSVVTELWDNIPVKRYIVSVHYNGGDVLEFLDKNKLKVIAKTELIENILTWLKGGI